MGGNTFDDKLKELARIEKEILISHEKDSNKDLVEDLYSQVLVLCRDTASYNKGIQLANQWLKLSEELESSDYEDLEINRIIFRIWIGSFYTETGDYESAIQNLVLAQDLLTSKNIDENKNLYSQIYYLLALIYYYKKDFVVSTELAQLSLKNFEEHTKGNQKEEDKTELFNIISILSWSLGGKGKFQEAYKLLSDFLTKMKDNSEYDLDLSVMQATQASFLQLIGNYNEANYLLDEIFTREVNKLGPNHPRLLSIRNSIGNVYYHLERIGDSVNLLSSTLEEAKVAFGNKNINLVNYYNNLSQVLISIDRNKEAIEYLNEFIDNNPSIIEEKTTTHSHLRIIVLLATTLKNSNYFEPAKYYYELFLRKTNSLYDNDNSLILDIQRNLCDVYVELGDY